MCVGPCASDSSYATYTNFHAHIWTQMCPELSMYVSPAKQQGVYLRASSRSVHIRVRICALKYVCTDFSIMEWGC